MSREILLLVDALAREKNVSEIVFLRWSGARSGNENASTTTPTCASPSTGKPAIMNPFRRWQVLPDEEVENDEAQMA